MPDKFQEQKEIFLWGFQNSLSYFFYFFIYNIFIIRILKGNLEIREVLLLFDIFCVLCIFCLILLIYVKEKYSCLVPENIYSTVKDVS